MRDFHELNWSEGTETVLALIRRLTVMRGMLETEPVLALNELCEAVIDGNIRRASDRLYAMTGALLKGSYRRVTGELFKDFIFSELFLSEHPFALMAAANRLDEAMYNAMREDLDVLFVLKELDGETLMRYIRERYRELVKKVHPTRDLAARRAEAAWGGSAVRPPEEDIGPLPKLPTFLPSGEPNWHYGEEELRDSFVSDEALEEMYHRFIEAGSDWSSLNEDLWNFFAAYGSGEFLRVRHFTWNQNGLYPVSDVLRAEPKPLMEQEYRACLSHFIAFMRGDSLRPMELIGAPGMGRTTMLFSLADELPELRLVYVPECASLSELKPLFDRLKDEPLKFAVVLDDADGAVPSELLIPANVLLVRVARKPMPCFVKRVNLPELKLDSFCDIVVKLLDSMDSVLPRDIVRSACVDHQVVSRGELTVAAAVRVAESLKAGG